MHVVAVGLGGHVDVEVMARAVADDRVLISADTDFGELLALDGASVPSVILLRRHHEAASQAGAVIAAIPDIEEALQSGVRRCGPGKRRRSETPLVRGVAAPAVAGV